MANNNNDKCLSVPKAVQIRVVEEMINSSRLAGDFYLMLVLSAIMVGLGLILDNTAVIIGGMLITPLLTPILTLSLGIVISDFKLITRSLKIIIKSSLIILGISFLIGLLFSGNLSGNTIIAKMSNNLPYFLVALAAGLAATFAWAREDLSAMLPGVAIAVSLLPPLASFGVGLSQFSGSIMRSSFLAFMLNMLGLLLGSIVIFSLLNFYKSKKETAKAVKEEIEETAKKDEEKKKIKQEKKEKKVSL